MKLVSVKRLFVAPMVAALAFGAGSASAVPVTINYEGRVDRVDAGLEGTFNTTQMLSASFTYESDTLPSSFPFTGAARWEDVIDSASFSIGTYTGSLGVGSFAFMEGDEQLDLGLFPPASPNVGTFSPELLILRLDSFSSVFPGLFALPTSIDFSDFDDGDLPWLLSFRTEDELLGVRGTLTSATTFAGPAPIPEPASGLLFAVGALAVGRSLRKRRTTAGVV